MKITINLMLRQNIATALQKYIMNSWKIRWIIETVWSEKLKLDWIIDSKFLLIIVRFEIEWTSPQKRFNFSNDCVVIMKFETAFWRFMAQNCTNIQHENVFMCEDKKNKYGIIINFRVQMLLFLFVSFHEWIVDVFACPKLITYTHKKYHERVWNVSTCFCSM